MTNSMISANKFLIIMGNSGSGKNFLAKKLIEEYPQFFEETIQVTTRAKRNDYDPYIFVDKNIRDFAYFVCIKNCTIREI